MVLGPAMFYILLLLPTHRGIFYIMEFLCCEIYEPFFPVYNISFVFHPTTRDVSFLYNCIVSSVHVCNGVDRDPDKPVLMKNIDSCNGRKSETGTKQRL